MRLILGLIFLALTLPSRSQTAEDIIEQYVEAVGGNKQWLTLDSYTAESTMDFYVSGFMLLKQSARIFEKKPRYSRSEIEISDDFQVFAYDGTTYWTERDKKAKPVTGFIKEKFLEGNFIFAGSLITPIFILTEDKDYQLELIRQIKLDSIDCWVIKFERKNFPTMYYYFDCSNSLLIARGLDLINTRIKPTNIEYIQDYKQVNGVLIAHTSICWQNGILSYIHKKHHIELNPQLNDNIFKMPENK
jgi:hypothetical protein